MIKLTDFKYGKIFVSDNDVYVGRTLIASGQYCDEEVELFKQLLKPTDNVIEVGANIGSLSIPIAQMIPNGILHAIEPQQVIFNMLSCNIAVNQLTNVKASRVAIGNSFGIVRLPVIDYDAIMNFGGVEINEKNTGDAVSLNTLDYAFQDIKSVKLIKIDVEGMEPSVLNGGRELIKKHRPFIYCENDRSSNSAKIIDILKCLNYKLYSHISHVFNRPNFNNNDANPFDKNYICINLLAVPNEVEIDCKLEELI